MIASADILFDLLDSTFMSDGELYFRRFMKRSPTNKWMISADFVIGEVGAAHDVFAFTIFPHYKEFSDNIDEITKIFPKDLKKTRIITDGMVGFLRDSRRFHFCFLVEKNRYKIGSIEDARLAIARSLQVIQKLGTRGLVDAEERRSLYIRKFQKIIQEAKANRFNYKNFYNIHILSVLLGTIMLWLVRHGECKLIGLFPDRDKMTTACGGIFKELTEINYFGFCQRVGLNTKIDILSPCGELLGSKGDFFYDALVRIPDYVAGALSRLDYKSGFLISGKEKHKDLVERFVLDNPNLLIIQISETLVSRSGSTVRVTTKPNQLSAINSEELMEYIVSKAHAFRLRQPRSYRQCLLDHASDWPISSFMLRSLLRGVAAGDPGCISIFYGKKSNFKHAFGSDIET